MDTERRIGVIASEVLGVAVLCLACAQNASAQTADTGGGIETVVVTAEKVQQNINDVPMSITRLGLEADLWGIPNPVVLMFVLYALAHVLMAHVRLGRYVYAVGGNSEAARLSGVPVRRVLIFVYTASGLFGGLGGHAPDQRLVDVDIAPVDVHAYSDRAVVEEPPVSLFGVGFQQLLSLGHRSGLRAEVLVHPP